MTNLDIIINKLKSIDVDYNLNKYQKENKRNRYILLFQNNFYTHLFSCTQTRKEPVKNLTSGLKTIDTECREIKGIDEEKFAELKKYKDISQQVVNYLTQNGNAVTPFSNGIKSYVAHNKANAFVSCMQYLLYILAIFIGAITTMDIEYLKELTHDAEKILANN